MRWLENFTIKLLPVCLVLLCAATASGAATAPYGPKRNDYVAYLRTQTGGDMEFWRGGAPMATVTDLEQYLARFALWAAVVRDAQKYKLVEAEEVILQDFKARAGAIQIEMFPKLRLALENVPPEGYGKTDVVLRTAGNGAKQAVFVGRRFAPNDSGRFFDDRLYRLLQQLRFESASYEVLDKGNSRTETTFLENQPPDGALVVWNSATGRLRIVE